MDTIQLIVNGVQVYASGAAAPPDSPPNPAPPAPPGPQPTPTPVPVPQPTPAGGEIRDVTWGMGLSYNTANAPVLAIDGPVAFRASLSYFNTKSSGATRYGQIQFYELTVPVEFCISATPYEFGGQASGQSPATQSNSKNYVSADSPSAPSDDYMQLPPLPAGQGHYYVNVRPVGGGGTTFLLFD